MSLNHFQNFQTVGTPDQIELQGLVSKIALEAKLEEAYQMNDLLLQWFGIITLTWLAISFALLVRQLVRFRRFKRSLSRR